TVIETCLTNLREADVEEIVVVVGHRAEAIREQLKHHPVKFALNSNPDTGMSVSIARGMDLVSQDAEAVLIAPADHPAVPPEIIRLLIDEWVGSSARLIQPEHEGKGGHPVLIDLAYRDELMRLDPRTGLRAFFN